MEDAMRLGKELALAAGPATGKPIDLELVG
jgi:hypothetical protein